MRQIPAAFCVLAVLWLGSCTDPDVTAPGLEVLASSPAAVPATVCGQTEEEVYVVRSGQTLEMDLRFTDDIALSQYKVDIHNAFDCHGHARSGTLLQDATEWTVLEISDIEGTEVDTRLSLQAPENPAAGVYHFQIQVIDQAGNDEPFAGLFDLVLINSTDSVAPELAIIEPMSMPASLTKGQTLLIAGTLQDNMPLGQGGFGKLILAYERLSNGNVFEAEELSFEGITENSAPFSFSWTVPTSLIAGPYEIILEATDGVNNESRMTWEVEITD